ncbi:thioredoxin family protein [Aquimarina addita]|uniref:Thioredoxin family protein n=1 Tax=Aquimarina addita TaxID=870485 RepID=A0ABP6UVJ9_9FLAO
MYYFRIKFLFFCILITLFNSCDVTKKNKNREDTYFGGEIVNPNTNYVVLSKGDSYGDTIYLNKDNKFLYKVKGFKNGLYSFRHSPETQLILLEKGDSTLIRLNTLEFDESLVFTGESARKNNFLIDVFLQNEKERDLLEKGGFNISPDHFVRSQDSLFDKKLFDFNNLTKKYKLSDLTKKICLASISYDFYARREMYAYRYQNFRMYKKELNKELPTSFFNYRNSINFNDDDLKRLYSYNRFLNHYFINTSFTNYSKKGLNTKDLIGNTIFKLNLIDSTIHHSYIKNNLLRGVTTNFILDHRNDYLSQKILDHYLSISSHEKFQQELIKLAKATSRLKPKNIIPDQELIASDGENLYLSTLFEKPFTALYFWSTERKDHYVKAHKKASYLSKRYPEIEFIAINTDDNQSENWIKTIKRNKYNLNREYEFKFPKCSSEELVLQYRNKVILINKDGEIITPNADLFSPAFERQLRIYNQMIEKKN